MTIELITVGKTDSREINALMSEYAKRINFYVKFSVTALPDVRTSKKLPVKTQRQTEGEMLLQQLSPSDYVILLDEKGADFNSPEFAEFTRKRIAGGFKRICFLIGGPYGFSEEIYERANEKIALSRMTFSHQMVRVIFMEQLYRAFTIINNEPYHHE